jgi:hypothetical protein
MFQIALICTKYCIIDEACSSADLQMKTTKNVLKTHFDISAYDRLRNSPNKILYLLACHFSHLDSFPHYLSSEEAGQ